MSTEEKTSDENEALVVESIRRLIDNIEMNVRSKRGAREMVSDAIEKSWVDGYIFLAECVLEKLRELIPDDGNDLDLLSTTDGSVWARRFVKRVQANPFIASDEGAMLAWFAGAIEVGRSAGQASSAAEPLEASK